jgi:SOS response regulatory protein OraA/RecX
MRNTREQLSLMDYALFLLGRQRYTVAGMRKKLNARVVKINRSAKMTLTASEISFPGSGATEDGEKIPAVIARLQELKLLNDEEFAELYIRDQLQRKPQGIRLLKRNMAQKGLEKAVIQQAVSETSDDLPATEYKLAERAAQKKLRTISKNPPKKQREKLARFLFSRGFSSSVALKVVNSKLGKVTE